MIGHLRRLRSFLGGCMSSITMGTEDIMVWFLQRIAVSQLSLFILL